MYSVTRIYSEGRASLLKTGLTLEEAQAHCADPETSSRTCTGDVLREHTERNGPWFDSYEAE